MAKSIAVVTHAEDVNIASGRSEASLRRLSIYESLYRLTRVVALTDAAPDVSTFDTLIVVGRVLAQSVGVANNATFMRWQRLDGRLIVVLPDVDRDATFWKSQHEVDRLRFFTRRIVALNDRQLAVA